MHVCMPQSRWEKVQHFRIYLTMSPDLSSFDVRQCKTLNAKQSTDMASVRQIKCL